MLSVGTEFIPVRIAQDEKCKIQLTQSDSGVPSSANWKPTKPLIRMQQYVAATRPVYIAANHCYANYVTPRSLKSLGK